MEVFLLLRKLLLWPDGDAYAFFASQARPHVLGSPFSPPDTHHAMASHTSLLEIRSTRPTNDLENQRQPRLAERGRPHLGLLALQVGIPIGSSCCFEHYEQQ